VLEISRMKAKEKFIVIHIGYILSFILVTELKQEIFSPKTVPYR